MHSGVNAFGASEPMQIGIGCTASYLLKFNVQNDPAGVIFAYNHLQSYVQSVLFYAGQYADGKFSVASAQLPLDSSVTGCAQTAGGVPRCALGFNAWVLALAGQS